MITAVYGAYFHFPGDMIMLTRDEVKDGGGIPGPCASFREKKRPSAGERREGLG